MSACRRTTGILDAWLETGQLADRDARHLAGCPNCTNALARVDAFDADVRTAVRSLVLQAEAAGVGPVAQPWDPPRSETPRLRFGAGLASLAAVVVLIFVAGIRLTAAPATPAEPVLPVPLGPAEQALHQSGLRCTEVATGLECTRRLSDGWQQVATLDVADGAVQGLEVRLVPGTAAFPVADVAAALAEPATDVLGIDVAEAADDAIACGCARPIDGGAIHVEGDLVTGYLLTLDVP